MALTEHETVESPDWWLLHLGKELSRRQQRLGRWWDYYRGEHPLPEGPENATQAFRDFQRNSRTNFCGEVVAASVARLRMIGITDEEGRPDTQAWQWLERNKMASKQRPLWRAALALSEAYLMVGLDPRSDEPQPLITVEHPREVIVDSDPATGERLAAVKAWYDERARLGRATVFLPDRKVRYVTAPRGLGPLRWGPATWTRDGDDVPYPGTLRQVPVIPFPCQPFPGEDPLAEFAMVIDIQDRINLGIFNRMSGERYAAFRQKWVKGHKFTKTTDSVTGLEVLDQPFVPGPGTVWASSGTDTQFGEFGQTQLGDYLRGHQMDIQDLLVISRTPAYTYAGDIVNVSFDTILAMDTNHVAKVEDHQAEFGEGVEATLGACAALVGEARDFALAKVRWKDPRQINPAVAADAAVKKKALGYPLAVLAEDLGESPPRVQRIVAEASADALMASSLMAAGQPGGQAGGVPAQPPAIEEA